MRKAELEALRAIAEAGDVDSRVSEGAFMLINSKRGRKLKPPGINLTNRVCIMCEGQVCEEYKHKFKRGKLNAIRTSIYCMDCGVAYHKLPPHMVDE